MSDNGVIIAQHPKDHCARISLIFDRLNSISRASVSNQEIGEIERACQELEDICVELMQIWNHFCIVPLIYLIEPVFGSFKILMALPDTRIIISCSQFLSSFMHHDVKLYSTIASERIFASIFDFSFLKMLTQNVQKVIKLVAEGFSQDSQLRAINAMVYLLSDLLENGASDLNMGSDFVIALFELYVLLMLNFNVEDPLHSCLIMKSSLAFPTVFKLRSKADIVAISKMKGNCSEDSIRGVQSREFRIQAWAALGSETFVLLHGIFSECFCCPNVFSTKSVQNVQTATQVLTELCRKRQFVCLSKVLERSNAAIQCIRLVMNALNRWRYQLVTGLARSKIDELKSSWFRSESSFLVFLLMYGFDTCETIRNQAMSTLIVIAKFSSSLFTQSENALLISDAVSIITVFCKCPRLLSDMQWLQRLCTNDFHSHAQLRSSIISLVRFNIHVLD
jgi:hypothetical protein